jgi:putative nucleotidyltransferase with HDIG domain
MKLGVNSFLRQADKLPSLPALYYELIRIIEDRNSSVEDICKVLRMDQGLVTRLLKLANSAFCGYSSKVATINQAVQIIGSREIHHLVLATSMIKAFSKIPSRLVDVTAFWEHSIACGIVTALLAERCNKPVPEQFFVAGLLHDVGRLILFLYAPGDSVEILETCEAEEELMFRVEPKVLGFNHAALGAELISLWRLPSAVREMVGGHHNPARSSVVQHAFLIHYADFIVHALELGSNGERFVPPLMVPDNCQGCLLEDYEMEFMAREIEAQCQEVFPILAGAN